MEILSRVLLESYLNGIGEFPCITTSSTPIRVVTTEVRYINALSLTIEPSIPTNSPAAQGLTAPRYVVKGICFSKIFEKNI